MFSTTRSVVQRTRLLTQSTRRRGTLNNNGKSLKNDLNNTTNDLNNNNVNCNSIKNDLNPTTLDKSSLLARVTEKLHPLRALMTQTLKQMKMIHGSNKTKHGNSQFNKKTLFCDGNMNIHSFFFNTHHSIHSTHSAHSKSNITSRIDSKFNTVNSTIPNKNVNFTPIPYFDPKKPPHPSCPLLPLLSMAPAVEYRLPGRSEISQDPEYQERQIREFQEDQERSHRRTIARSAQQSEWARNNPSGNMYSATGQNRTPEKERSLVDGFRPQEKKEFWELKKGLKQRPLSERIRDGENSSKSNRDRNNNDRDSQNYWNSNNSNNSNDSNNFDREPNHSHSNQDRKMNKRDGNGRGSSDDKPNLLSDRLMNARRGIDEKRRDQQRREYTDSSDNDDYDTNNNKRGSNDGDDDRKSRNNISRHQNFDPKKNRDTILAEELNERKRAQNGRNGQNGQNGGKMNQNGRNALLDDNVDSSKLSFSDRMARNRLLRRQGRDISPPLSGGKNDTKDENDSKNVNNAKNTKNTKSFKNSKNDEKDQKNDPKSALKKQKEEEFLKVRNRRKLPLPDSDSDAPSGRIRWKNDPRDKYKNDTDQDDYDDYDDKNNKKDKRDKNDKNDKNDKKDQKDKNDKNDKNDKKADHLPFNMSQRDADRYDAESARKGSRDMSYEPPVALLRFFVNGRAKAVDDEELLFVLRFLALTSYAEQHPEFVLTQRDLEDRSQDEALWNKAMEQSGSREQLVITLSPVIKEIAKNFQEEKKRREEEIEQEQENKKVHEMWDYQNSSYETWGSGGWNGQDDGPFQNNDKDYGDEPMNTFKPGSLAKKSWNQSEKNNSNNSNGRSSLLPSRGKDSTLGRLKGRDEYKADYDDNMSPHYRPQAPPLQPPDDDDDDEHEMYDNYGRVVGNNNNPNKNRNGPNNNNPNNRNGPNNNNRNNDQPIDSNDKSSTKPSRPRANASKRPVEDEYFASINDETGDYDGDSNIDFEHHRRARNDFYDRNNVYGTDDELDDPFMADPKRMAQRDKLRRDFSRAQQESEMDSGKGNGNEKGPNGKKLGKYAPDYGFQRFDKNNPLPQRDDVVKAHPLLQLPDYLDPSVTPLQNPSGMPILKKEEPEFYSPSRRRVDSVDQRGGFPIQGRQNSQKIQRRVDRIREYERERSDFVDRESDKYDYDWSTFRG